MTMDAAQSKRIVVAFASELTTVLEGKSLADLPNTPDGRDAFWSALETVAQRQQGWSPERLRKELHGRAPMRNLLFDAFTAVKRGASIEEIRCIAANRNLSEDQVLGNLNEAISRLCDSFRSEIGIAMQVRNDNLHNGTDRSQLQQWYEQVCSEIETNISREIDGVVGELARLPREHGEGPATQRDRDGLLRNLARLSRLKASLEGDLRS